MCNFFSAISDGKGNVLFFKVEEIASEMAKGNPKEYNWNSHTSIASFNGIHGADEDKWNKWEYNVDEKVLSIDQLNTVNDKLKVKKQIEEFFKDKNIIYMRNLYNSNSGDRNSGNWNSGNSNSGYSNSGNSNSGNTNSGNWNSGYSNSGNSNSGDRNSGNSNSGNSNSGDSNSGNSNSGNSNSGDRNSGNWNSGNSNSGDRNSGNSNSGNSNSGDRNSGNSNSGHRNSGYRNSGNRNSGNRNSGNSNSGNSNSGNWNSGNNNSGYLNTNKPDKIRIFNQWFDNADNIQWPDFFYFDLTQWVSHDTATQQEKKDHKVEIETCGGFLKELDYKEAWQLSYKKATKEDRALVKKIPGFNKDLFFEITGIKIR